MKGLASIAAFGVLVGLLGCGGTPKEPPKELNGAGSTFVYPMMHQWSDEYEHREDGCKVNYRSLGSGAGIKFIIEKKVDFGCSDAPLTDEELAQARSTGGELVHIPLIMGAVVPAYNLAEVNEPLRFTGPVLADIFLGKIKKWNDEALQRLNPGAKLPDKEIVVVSRRDGSGTTYVWTDYLSKVSLEWKDKVGKGVEVTWTTGKQEVGNDGVGKGIKQTPGSIGYVELVYAYQLDLPFGLVQNRAGEFVKASLGGVTTAADNALPEIPKDLRFSLTDPPGKDSYPICGTTWAIVNVNQPHAKGKLLVDFLEWVIDEGQANAHKLFYARLPQPLVKLAREKLREVKVGK